MVAADRRARRGAFEVHYLFAPGRASTGSSTRRRRCPPRRPRSRRWPRSTIRRHASSARSTTCSASWPTGTPIPRPLVRHGVLAGRLLPAPQGRRAPREFHDDGRAFPFTQVGGEGVYEIPVGPVHAGIIEPGHFRFSVVGETIIDMKSRLYFTHKGTEKLFEGRDARGRGRAGRARVRGHDASGTRWPTARRSRRWPAPSCRPGRGTCAWSCWRWSGSTTTSADFGMIANDTGFARGPLALLPDPRAAAAPEQAADRQPAAAGRRRPRRCPDRSAARGSTSRSEVRRRSRDFDEIVEISLGNTLVAGPARRDGPADHPDRARSRRPRLRGARLGAGRRRAARPSIRGVRGAVVPGARVRRRAT